MSNQAYAVVEIAGRQFRVSEGQKVICNLLESAPGSAVEFKNVSLVKSGSNVKVGAPLVSGAKVQATVEKHFDGDKVLVFKYLRKNRAKKMHGHRQPYTLLKISKIEA